MDSYQIFSMIGCKTNNERSNDYETIIEGFAGYDISSVLAYRYGHIDGYKDK